MESKKHVYEIGRVVESENKSTKEKYLMFEATEDVVLKKGERFYMNDFLEDLQKSVDAGRLTEAKAEDLANKMSFVKYKVIRPKPRAS